MEHGFIDLCFIRVSSVAKKAVANFGVLGRSPRATRLYRYGRRLLPFLISFGLVGWLVWTITPQKMAAALSLAGWPWLVLATLVQVVILFTWDTLSLWWLFSQPDRPLPFSTILRVRTETVIWSVVNLEVGQGMFAWQLAAARDEPVIQALGRCLVLALFDFGTLQSLALVGSFLAPTPLICSLRWICIVSVVGLALLAGLLRFLPERCRHWLISQSWANWLAWWRWRHSLLLAVQRLILFLLVILYAGVGLAICGVRVDPATVLGVIPFVLIAESLPGTGGLGERETALVYLLADHGPPAVLLDFGLIWSAGTILGRIAIGLGSTLLRHPAPPADCEERPPTSALALHPGPH
jgi:hypothetical protein